MGGAAPPLLQYAFMAWCSVGGAQGQLYLFTFTYSVCSNPQISGKVLQLIRQVAGKWGRVED
jgi:hypothetical protein